jgi:hypothetical protein
LLAAALIKCLFTLMERIGELVKHEHPSSKQQRNNAQRE